MSTTIVSALVILLATILPLLGIKWSSEETTTVVQAIVIIASSINIWYQRTTLQKAPSGFGDTGYLGFRRR